MNMLFENPWMLVVGLLAIAAVLRWVGVRSSRPPLVLGSYGVLLLAVGLVAAAQWVNTAREQIEAQTKAMLASAESAGTGGATHGAAPPLTDFFAETVFLERADGSPWETLTPADLTRDLKRHRVRGHLLRDVKVTLDPHVKTRGVVNMRVSSRVGEGYPAATTWEMGWTRTPKGWRIDRVRWPRLGQNEPSPGLYR
ncbi:MAG: hypothetical protein V3V20_01505 [Algisphaera sp.]